MTTDDLAGLLAEHRSWRARAKGAYCTCGEHLVWSIQPNDTYPALAAHQAAVIAAAGWRRGREEFGVRERAGHIEERPSREHAENLRDWHLQGGRSYPLVRRYVTDWEAMEEA